MSTYYLLDPFNNTSNLPVFDIVSNDAGQVDTTGAHAVRIPGGAPIDGQPRDLNELSAAIRTGLLAKYAGSGFTRCLLEPCLTPDRVDLANCSQVMVASGGRSNSCIITSGGYLQTTKFSLDLAPSSYAVVWLPYSITITDPIGGRTTRRYDDRDPTVLTCQATFDGKSPVTVANGVIQTVAASASAAALTLKFTSVVAGRLFLGTWAVVYK